MYATISTSTAKKEVSMTSRIKSLRIVMQITQLFSVVLGQKITARFALSFIHAQIALMSLCIVNTSSLLLFGVLLLWFIVSAWQCRLAANGMSSPEDEE